MSRRSRYTISSVDDIVLSVVDLLLRYATWVMGNAESNLTFQQLVIHVKNLLKKGTQLNVICVRQKYILNATTQIILTLYTLSFVIKHGIAAIAVKIRVRL